MKYVVAFCGICYLAGTLFCLGFAGCGLIKYVYSHHINSKPTSTVKRTEYLNKFEGTYPGEEMKGVTTKHSVLFSCYVNVNDSNFNWLELSSQSPIKKIGDSCCCKISECYMLNPKCVVFRYENGKMLLCKSESEIQVGNMHFVIGN